MNLKVYEIAYDETLTVDGTVAAQIVSYDVVFSDQGPQGIQGIQGIQGPTGTSALTNQGDILYRNATVPDRLPIGTAGQFLKVNTGATAPEWATITKSTVGLGNVDNTSDSNKPVSTATQAALDLKANLASPTFTGTVSGITKSMVGLGNVDNTSDANKPISSATQTALDGKASSAAAVPSGGTTGQVLRKKTNSNYDTEWGDESGGGGGVPTSRTISAGTGLTGGGDLSANRTLAVSYGTTAGTACQGNDGRIAYIASGAIDQRILFGGGGSVGSINMTAVDGTSGSINTSDGGGDGLGGSINTSAHSSGLYGGSINTSANIGGAGGSINTSAGGGSINTRGTGSIEFGIAGTRTTLTGTATADRAISLPDAAGTLALTSDITKSAVGLGNVTNNAQVTSVTGTAPIVSSGGTTPTISVTIGSTAGTVAAGNDSRITGAAQKSANLSDLASASTARTNLGLGTAATAATGDFAAAAHTHAASAISDSTTAGRALLTAADAAAQRTSLGLGTLSTQSGTFSGTSSGTNTGDQTISLTGDVTGSGTGSFAATIANNAVTNAKLAQIATSTIKGRATAGTGNVEDLSSTQVLNILGLLGAIKDMKIVSPSSDVTATSSTTLSNVSGMSFSVAANTTYLILTNLQMSVGAGGYNCEISFPSILNNGITASGFGVQLPGSNSLAGLSTTSATTVKVSNRGAAQTTPSFSILLVRTDSTGGTANFQWAQNTSSAAASTLSSNTRALIVPLTT